MRPLLLCEVTDDLLGTSGFSHVCFLLQCVTSELLPWLLRDLGVWVCLIEYRSLNLPITTQFWSFVVPLPVVNVGSSDVSFSLNVGLGISVHLRAASAIANYAMWCQPSVNIEAKQWNQRMRRIVLVFPCDLCAFYPTWLHLFLAHYIFYTDAKARINLDRAKCNSSPAALLTSLVTVELGASLPWTCLHGIKTSLRFLACHASKTAAGILVYYSEAER